jgi:hypothetical protein
LPLDGRGAPAPIHPRDYVLGRYGPSVLAARHALAFNCPTKLAGLNVLVAEDKEDHACSPELLEKRGARVTGDGTAAEALDEFERTRPAVLSVTTGCRAGTATRCDTRGVNSRKASPAFALCHAACDHYENFSRKIVSKEL